MGNPLLCCSASSAFCLAGRSAVICETGCALWVRVEADQVAFHGTLCTGGSFEPHPLTAFSQAVWGVVAIYSEGKGTIRAYGPVWRPLIQSAPSAEVCALAVASQLAVARTHLICDCQVLLDHVMQNERKLLSPNSVFAGYLRYAYMQQGWRHISMYEKVKSHQNWQELSGRDKVITRGNTGADVAACKGRDMQTVLFEKRLQLRAGTFIELVNTWNGRRLHWETFRRQARPATSCCRVRN